MMAPSDELATFEPGPAQVQQRPARKVCKKKRPPQKLILPPAEAAKQRADAAADGGLQRMLEYDLSERERVLALPRLEQELQHTIRVTLTEAQQDLSHLDRSEREDVEQYVAELVNEACSQLRQEMLLSDDQIKRRKMARGELSSYDQAKISAVATSKKALQESIMGNPPIPEVPEGTGWFDGLWRVLDRMAAHQANRTFHSYG